jgi:signal transduction histidine kinase
MGSIYTDSELAHLSNDELVAYIRCLEKDKLDLASDAAAHAKALESLDILEALNQVNTDYITVDSDNNIFHRLLEKFISITKSEYGFIDELFYNEDGSMYLEARSITNIAWDDNSRLLYDKLVTGEIKFDNIKSVYGQVLLHKKPYISNNVPGDKNKTGVPPGHPPLDQFLGLPLIAGGQFVGMIGLANGRNGEIGYSQHSIDMLEPLTQICSVIMLSYKTEMNRLKALQNAEFLTKELERSNHELEQFAYVASHDLKAPLRGISNVLGWLEDDLINELSDTNNAHFKKIKARIARMNKMLEDLLLYAKLDFNQEATELVDLQEMLTNILSLHEDNDKVIQIHGVENLGTIKTQRKALDIVMRNLISNAIKHHDKDHVLIQIKMNYKQPFIQFEVHDDGPGIDEKNRDVVFKMFKSLRSKDEVEGSGLGLSIVKRLVQSQGGKVNICDCKSNTGCRVIFNWRGAPV